MTLDALLEAVARTFGLKPGQDWRAIAEAGLPAIAARRGVSVPTLLARGDHQESVIAELAEFLTIGETYFLRHPTHFEALSRHIAAALAEPERTAYVWCAGCATGEEPYSIAISVAEHRGEASLARLKIFATDANPAAIARARAGVYSQWSLRDAPPWLSARYFTAVGANEWRLTSAPVLSAVTFDVADIAARALTMSDAALDAMLFRNVGIYMTQAAVALIHEQAQRIVKPGGLFLVAPSDPRPDSPFQPCDDATTSVYQRAPQGPAAAPPARASQPRSSPSTRPPPPRRTPSGSIMTRPAPPMRPPPPSPPSPSPPQGPAPASSIAAARALANAGDLDAALAALERASPRSSEGALLCAQILMEKGRHDAAIDELRRLTFIEPGHRIARYWYALALAAGGRTAQALAQARALSGELARSPSRATLEDGRTTPEELCAAAKALEMRLE